MTPARTPTAEAVALSEWARAPAYWGPYRDDDYIFRRDFSLPRAANYDGSELSLGIIADARPIPIYLNGVDVGARYDDSFLRGPIGSRLRPGRNVIAIEVNGSSGRFMRCAGGRTRSSISSPAWYRPWLCATTCSSSRARRSPRQRACCPI